MATKGDLTDYLNETMAGVPVTEIARRTGINIATVSRLRSGIKQPSFENVIRLAWHLGEHPAVLFERSNQPVMAQMMRDLFPEKPARPKKTARTRVAQELHEKLDLLIARGLSDDTQDSLAELEARWASIQPQFEALAQEVGASGACLIADHAFEGDVICRWRCADPEARALVQQRGMTGWESCQFSSGRLRLQLFLKDPQRPLKEWAQPALVLWAAALGGSNAADG